MSRTKEARVRKIEPRAGGARGPAPLRLAPSSPAAPAARAPEEPRVERAALPGLATARVEALEGDRVHLVVAGEPVIATRDPGVHVAVLTDPDGRYGPDDVLRRRLDAPGIGALLEGTGRLRVELVQGDGVLEAWLPNAVREGGPAAVRSAAELEELAARWGIEPARDLVPA